MVPESGVEAVLITPPYTPELLSPVATVVEQFLLDRFFTAGGRKPTALELGAGWSTLWLAEYCDLTSLEHDEPWFEAARFAMEQSQLPANVQLWAPQDFLAVLRGMPPESLDFVYVDCVDKQRVPCGKECRRLVKPGGLVAIDDSHWDMLKPLMDHYADWRNVTVSGMHTRKTGEVKFHQTTLYWRPM